MTSNSFACYRCAVSIKSLAIALACAAALPGRAATEPEVVILSPEKGVTVELRAEVIEAAERTAAPGLCVWRGQLWQHTSTNPPERVLASATVTIDGATVDLDVSGLAMPWIVPEEMAEQDCRLTKYSIGEEEEQTFYTLDICFFKGGAEDYIVTWLIYEGHSMRIHVEDVGDMPPDWYMEEEEGEPAEE